jgi:hypothetical protein
MSLPSQTRDLKVALLAGVVGLGTTILVAWWSVANLPMSTAPPWRIFPDQPWIDGLVRWDAEWYASVARDGYQSAEGVPSNTAFFPLYPLAIRALTPVVDGTYTAGIVVGALAGVFSVVLLAVWASNTVAKDVQLAPIALVLFPASFYLFGVMYAESTFLALALTSFTLVERGRPVAAGLFGALASLTRPVGVFVAIALAIRQLELRRFEPQSEDGRLSGLGVLIAFSGLGAFLITQWSAVGNPFAFLLEGASTWGHGLDLTTVLKVQDWTADQSLWPLSISQGIVTVAALSMIPVVRRRFGWAYAIYTAGVILVPVILRPTIIGAARYVLVAFPLFAAVGPLLRKLGTWSAVVVGLSIALFIEYTSLFSRWFFVG